MPNLEQRLATLETTAQQAAKQHGRIVLFDDPENPDDIAEGLAEARRQAGPNGMVVRVVRPRMQERGA